MIFESYRFLNDYFTAKVRNTSKGIEISDVKEKGRTAPRRSADIRDSLLSPFKQPYSKIDVSTTEGKKELQRELKEEIKALEYRIAKLSIAIQMCKRKNVFFKDK